MGYQVVVKEYEMHDIKYIRENGEAFDAAMERRGLGAMSSVIIDMDQARRDVQTKLQELQAARNAESKKIGEIKKAGGDAQGAMDAVAAIKAEMGALEEKERVLAHGLNEHLAGLPNIMADDVPDGADEDENVEVRTWGEPKNPNGANTVPEHFEIGEALGLMDFETAAKISGSRFVILSGALARMERALAQFFLDTHTAIAIDNDERSSGGYTEVSPPLLVRDEALFGTGQLPKFEEDLYKCITAFNEDYVRLKMNYEATNADFEALKAEMSSGEAIDEALMDAMANRFARLKIKREETLKALKDAEKENPTLIRSSWPIPTSEVPLTNIVADSIVDEASLPRRYTAFTPCFRSEAGSAGKDTRGMIRQHQFYKVEMVGIVRPEDSEAEQERMVKCAETVLQKLELPYRIVKLCSGDTGFGARRTFDIEAWLPGQQRYREISSVSTCGDFQARRMNARFKREGEKQTTFLHTLNGSGVAVGRALIAVLENYYDPADGGVHVPDVLKPYMGGVEKIVKA